MNPIKSFTRFGWALFALLIAGCSEEPVPQQPQVGLQTNKDAIVFTPAKRITPGARAIDFGTADPSGGVPAEPQERVLAEQNPALSIPVAPTPGHPPEERVSMAPPPRPANPNPRSSPPGIPRREDPFETARASMVATQLAVRGITEPVLSAKAAVPRHQFVPAQMLADSYDDMELNLGHNASLRTPFTLAATAQHLAATPNARVLEIGSDGGYTAAVLSHFIKEVCTVADNPIMHQRVAVDLQRNGYTNNIFVDHSQGQTWLAKGPYDAIVLNAPDIPQESLIPLLHGGGKVILPIDGNGNQQVLQKSGNSLLPQSVRPVRLAPVAPNKVALSPAVPMTRRAQ